ncbi:mitogen-activated protein kinase kinase kinase 3 isoform X1 [Hydra vulgaris]|uniref:Mitogen-activated protein kinase kinase kinase 3 n=1 Tax=Hydra vulgaris TaxID=6087 RepID=T2M6M6_HYDVU|nr:mitogen-activated protein kinase kinase kinase 3 isoform X1 [Hydra vulgaris]
MWHNASHRSHQRSNVDVDMRVKLEYQGERRIVPIARPVMIDQLQIKIKKAFGEELDINYENGAVYIPITKQRDLDKAIALLDQSPHLTSLRLTLTQKSISSDTLLEHDRVNDYNENILSYVASRPLPIRTRSNPEELSSPDIELSNLVRPHSMHIPRSSLNYGDSPPPGHYHLKNNLDTHEVQNGGGVFIPEDGNDDEYNRLNQHSKDNFDCIDPLSHFNQNHNKQSFESMFESSFNIGNSSNRNLNNGFEKKRRPHSELISDTYATIEYDSDGGSRSKSTLQHQSDWNLHQDNIEDTFRWMDCHSNNFVPIQRASSSSSVGYGSNSSNDGLMLDSEYSYCNNKLLLNNHDRLNLDEPLENDINFKWKQVRQIGSGGFGTVYLCVDLNTGKELAMKYIETGHINTAALKEVEILQREISLYKTLNHERIVEYYGTIQANTSISIFMEYMEGGSIHDKISKIGALDEKETSCYCFQILEGINYLHSKNIIHRDIKGANILLDSSGNCKLADFGASKQIQTIRSQTGCKSVHGTPYWMSPEVINGAGYGRKADIWSLGCTVLEMLTTKPPWFQFEPMAALFKIATQTTIPHLPDDSSISCKRFVDDCFKRDPSLRPNALELLSYAFVKR